MHLFKVLSQNVLFRSANVFTIKTYKQFVRRLNTFGTMNSLIIVAKSKGFTSEVKLLFNCYY